MMKDEFIYGSVCSGIEAAAVAWNSLGWQQAWSSEIAPFPCEILSWHYPRVPNLGDMKEIHNATAIDILIGGTPCQSFAIGGSRTGLDSETGQLAKHYIRLLSTLHPKWVVWENVPGVLSSHKGRDFGTFLHGLAKCGYGFAYRVLDASFFGVPQKRRRVFVVGYLGDWRPAAAVLFDSKDCFTPLSSRRKGQTFSSMVAECVGDKPIVFKIRAFGKGTGEKGGRIHPYSGNGGYLGWEDRAFTLVTAPDQWLFINGKVRHFTPLECERLQGFPDDYTNIPDATSNQRYKVLGNSIAVPVLHWIGERIQDVQTTLTSQNIHSKL